MLESLSILVCLLWAHGGPVSLKLNRLERKQAAYGYFVQSVGFNSKVLAVTQNQQQIIPVIKL